MKTTLIFVLTSLLLMISNAVSAQYEWGDEDKTLSPHFYIPSDHPDTEILPLRSTSAKVSIAGVIADVTIRQEYKNDGQIPIEAVYVFPASTRAAVYAMVMTIGERVVVARIEEKDRARKQYEEARDNGQSASLLEQERPNVFSMNVANIMPGDLVTVELKYTELLVPHDRIYRFVYPTVVGPRYSGRTGEMASLGEAWNANPYTLEGVPPLYGFDIEVELNAGMAIKDLRCPTHKTSVNYTGKTTASVTLDVEEIYGGNRDFVLEYRLAGEKIETGLLLYEGEKENFFLAMIQPPDRISPGIIPPREYVFIMDVSGSMHGFPIETSKELLRDLLSGLDPTDRFNVILFAGGSSLFARQSVPASSENIRTAITFIEKEQGGGGTELLPALKKALKLQGTKGFSRTFIIATDGYVTVEREAFELVGNSLGEANFFAFGIGSGVNRYLIEGLAHAGQGEPFVLNNSSEAKVAAERFRKYISSPVLTNIEVSFDNFDVYELAQNAWPDVFADRPVLIFGKYHGQATGSIALRGIYGKGITRQRLDLAMGSPDKENAALRYLWARDRIRMIDDLSANGYETQVEYHELTQLGLEYNLLTRYTSFIAIDSEVRNENGNLASIRQPLPLPQGVSNYAVGGVMAKSPPKTGKRGNMATQTANISFEEGYIMEEDHYRVEITPPSFKGSDNALKQFLEKNLLYPASAREKGLEGIVFVSFIVEKDGSISNVKVFRGIGGDCDKEAVRLVSIMPDWIPATHQGKPVEVHYTLPIKFVLSEY